MRDQTAGCHGDRECKCCSQIGVSATPVEVVRFPPTVNQWSPGIDISRATRVAIHQCLHATLQQQ